MRRVLILFATSHGQTRMIGERLATVLRIAGHDVLLQDLAHGPPGPAGFDAVVLGSRVQFDRHARSLYRYVRRHQADLDPRRTWFYSVSMSAVAGTADPGGYLHDFVRRSGFEPHRATSFAGALRYTRYDPLTRFVMKRISARRHHATETWRDHEYTDWAAVDKLAREIADELAPPAQAAALGLPTDAPPQAELPELRVVGQETVLRR